MREVYIKTNAMVEWKRMFNYNAQLLTVSHPIPNKQNIV